MAVVLVVLLSRADATVPIPGWNTVDADVLRQMPKLAAKHAHLALAA